MWTWTCLQHSMLLAFVSFSEWYKSNELYMLLVSWKGAHVCAYDVIFICNQITSTAVMENSLLAVHHKRVYFKAWDWWCQKERALDIFVNLKQTYTVVSPLKSLCLEDVAQFRIALVELRMYKSRYLGLEHLEMCSLSVGEKKLKNHKCHYAK